MQGPSEPPTESDAPTVPPSARAAPDRFGPCLLLRKLGSGGMGAVYLAELTEDRPYAARGSRVAVKVLLPGLLPSMRGQDRLALEAHLGMTLRHPSLVRAHELATAERDGVRYPYLVMEYVEGQTLRALLQGLGAVPEALVRHLGAQIASALAEVHAAGAVHRDLKPSNVLITPEHQVKLMDLGIALLQDEAQRITLDGQFVGTPSYAAPEQFRAGRVTPAADLYALGVVLYELATGNNPFSDRTPHAALAPPADARPVRVDLVKPALSPFLAEVVDCLLATDPGRRPGPAAALAAILNQGEESSWWVERECSLLRRDRQAGLRGRRVEHALPLVGRARELDVLAGAWHEACDGRGGLVLVEGEAGVGKSRLVDELLGLAARADARILAGTALPGGGSTGGPGPLSEALVAALGTPTLEHALARLLHDLPRVVPGFAAALAGTPPAAGADPLATDALQGIFCHVGRRLAAESPVLWIVEDVHLASPEQRAVLLALARVAHAERLLLVATTRPGLPPG